VIYESEWGTDHCGCWFAYNFCCLYCAILWDYWAFRWSEKWISHMCKPVNTSIQKWGIFSAASMIGRSLMLLYFNERWASIELKMLVKVDVCLNDWMMIADISAFCHERVKVFCLWVCNGHIGSSGYWHQNCKRYGSMKKVEIEWMWCYITGTAVHRDESQR